LIVKTGPKALNMLLDIVEKFKLLDKDNEGEITVTGLMRVLREYKLKDNIDLLLNKYKGSSKETFRYKDFLQELIQPLPSHRKNIVLEKFSKLFPKLIKKLTLISMYDPTEHPFVISGRQTKANAILELQRAVDTYSRITLNESDHLKRAELIDFFKYLSATVEHSKEFEGIIKKCWKPLKKPSKAEEPIVRKVKEFELKPPFGISKDKTLYVTTQQDMNKKVVKVKPEIKTNEVMFAEVRKYLKEHGIRKILEVQSLLQVFGLLIV
jgi:hypothetical protein